MAGTLFYVIGPSGVGKDTILNAAKKQLGTSPVVFAHRYITRPAKAGGENHIELTREEFQKRLQADSFAMNWESHGCQYGIGVEIMHWMKQGMSVVVNGSRAHLPEVQEQFPTVQPILITAPDDVLAKRLKARGREDNAAIAKRIEHNATLPTKQIEEISQNNLLILSNDSTIESAVETFCTFCTSQNI